MQGVNGEFMGNLKMGGPLGTRCPNEGMIRGPNGVCSLGWANQGLG